MRLLALCAVLLVAAACAPSTSRVDTERGSSPPSPALAAADVALQYQLGPWLDALRRNEAEAPVMVKLKQPITKSDNYPSSGRCGGSLPPCSVMMCESGGSLTAHNPRSTASGKWQILDTTWNGYGGYRHASDAPEDVQDARAREIYAGGAGRSAWVC